MYGVSVSYYGSSNRAYAFIYNQTSFTLTNQDTFIRMEDTGHRAVDFSSDTTKILMTTANKVFLLRGNCPAG